jgi:hypothetical protein
MNAGLSVNASEIVSEDAGSWKFREIKPPTFKE